MPLITLLISIFPNVLNSLLLLNYNIPTGKWLLNLKTLKFLIWVFSDMFSRSAEGRKENGKITFIGDIIDRTKHILWNFFTYLIQRAGQSKYYHVHFIDRWSPNHVNAYQPNEVVSNNTAPFMSFYSFNSLNKTILWAKGMLAFK